MLSHWVTNLRSCFWQFGLCTRAILRSLPGKDYFGRVNIIMRDFVGAEKCRQIIALNKDKGTIANDKLSEFVSKCALNTKCVSIQNKSY